MAQVMIDMRVLLKGEIRCEVVKWIYIRKYIAKWTGYMYVYTWIKYVYDSKSLGFFKVECSLLIAVSVPLYYLFHPGNKLDELSHSLYAT
jgi:hypothetical protein